MIRLITIMSILAISCSDSGSEKERMNQSATKLQVMDVTTERIYDLNQMIKHDSIKKDLRFFYSMDDTLEQIRDELISAAGGYTELGQYFNLPASNYVEDYFYGETHFRNNSHKYFFGSLNEFIKKLKEVYPQSTFEQRINHKFQILIDYYGLQTKELIFKKMTLNEAVELIESFRKAIALEQTEYLINNEIAS